MEEHEAPRRHTLGYWRAVWAWTANLTISKFVNT